MKLFLLRTLVGVFAFQGVLLLIAYMKCQSVTQCPNLADKTEKLFAIATATTLSLLAKEE